MLIINGQRYYTIGEAAAIIGRSAQTLRNWLKWQEEFGDINDLPKPVRGLNKLNTRYFTDKDIDRLVKFRDSINYGDLAEYNRRKWGKRNPENV